MVYNYNYLNQQLHICHMIEDSSLAVFVLH